MNFNVEGITAHASMPELKGADAIAGIAFMIAEIRKSDGKKVPTHEELGKSTVTFGQISGGYSPYVVSDHRPNLIEVQKDSYKWFWTKA